MLETQSQRPKVGSKRFSFSAKVKQLLTPPSSQSVSPASSRTPSSNSSCVNEPHPLLGSLEQRYGKAGKLLGDGTSGTVKLHTNPHDGTVVAVKKFRCDRPVKDGKAFAKKITAEYEAAAALKHGNVIKVLEVVKENGSWFQVAEYAPVELYEVAESRIMSLEEKYCAWGQVLEGASYLHRQGIAHRDLSLENIVVTEQGIMKIIDFGSATVFRPQSSCTVVLARGYVGCEPYMAPEIFSGNQYDPRAVDVWGLAIIFCRLVLGHFPWQIAEQSDPSFWSFSKPANPTCGSLDEYAQNCTTGPTTLLKDLPSECRLTIKGMLQVTPSRRLSLRQVLQHPWVKRLAVCSEDQDGKVHQAKGHEHLLPSSTLSPAISRVDTNVASPTLTPAISRIDTKMASATLTPATSRMDTDIASPILSPAISQEVTNTEV